MPSGLTGPGDTQTVRKFPDHDYFYFRFGWFSDPDADPGLEGYHRLGSPLHAAFRYAKQRPPHHARAATVGITCLKLTAAAAAQAHTKTM
ncbi:hypothetical protein Pint_27361 [Pistacia integerrima]|uniref:Uncharacterized protein n=1 Tax=Pistacia integerrima TaxID=434235 RepID=A0ACC0YMI3_9ROSI|nr:hypothetical protein Pint_27361 [Pistacia integerrima]